MNKYILFLFFFSLLILSRELYTQNKISNNDLRDCIENFYGDNDLLINGNTYIPVNPRITGHPFYLKDEYRSGKVFIKGQSFEDLHLKYDIVNDDLILLHKYKNGSKKEIILSNKLIDSFYISTNIRKKHFDHFINKSLPDNNNSEIGYIKLVHKGKVSFYRKYKKSYFSTYTAINPFGLFSKSTNIIYISKNKSLYKIKNKRSLLSFFKKYKTQIKKFLKKNKIKFKKISDDQLIQLSKYINSLLDDKDQA